jgi:chromosomal replication initiation ATPase DnaA
VRSKTAVAELTTKLIVKFGLLADIEPPDLERRIAILQNKARDAPGNRPE